MHGVVHHCGWQKFLLQSPFAGFSHVHTGKAMLFAQRSNFLHQVVLTGVAKFAVVNGVAGFAQFFSKVAHGTEKQGDTYLVNPHHG